MTLLDIRTACLSARKYAQEAADLAVTLQGQAVDDMLLSKAESNLRRARVACDAALERVARLRASR